ncbi:hypothetical protein D3C75_1111210 [compost metagenome]
MRLVSLAGLGLAQDFVGRCVLACDFIKAGFLCCVFGSLLGGVTLALGVMLGFDLVALGLSCAAL